jgi:branched-chain amino acid transport system permease protein
LSSADVVAVFVRGFQTGSVYALLAMGFATILSTSKIINFAHGHMFMAGTVAAWVLLDQAGLPLPLALIIATLSVGLVAIVQEQVAVRPVMRVSGAWGWALSTIGFGAIMTWAASKILDNQTRAVDYYLPRQYTEIAGVTVNLHMVMMIGVAVLVGLILFLFFERTIIGKALKAIAQDPEAASLRGIDVPRLRTLAFFIGSAIAGGTGFLMTPFSLADAFVGLNLVLKAFVATIIGGGANIGGALLGGFVLAVLEEWSVQVAGVGYRDTSVVALLVVIMLLRPEGILSRRRRLV